MHLNVRLGSLGQNISSIDSRQLEQDSESISTQNINSTD